MFYLLDVGGRVGLASLLKMALGGKPSPSSKAVAFSRGFLKPCPGESRRFSTELSGAPSTLIGATCAGRLPNARDVQTALQRHQESLEVPHRNQRPQPPIASVFQGRIRQ